MEKKTDKTSNWNLVRRNFQSRSHGEPSRSVSMYDILPDQSTSESESGAGERRPQHQIYAENVEEEMEEEDIEMEEEEVQPRPLPVIDPLPRLTREEARFFRAVESGDVDTVRAIIASNVFQRMDINKLNRMGYSVLHLAVHGKHGEIVMLLLQQPGIRLFDTILHAIRTESVEITNLLLDFHDIYVRSQQNSQSGSNSEMDPRIVTPMSMRSGLRSSITPGSHLAPQAQLRNRISSVHFQEDGSFDSEFNPVITPLMLAAQIGNTKLMEIFYKRGERLETDTFTHNVKCECDICEVLIGERDMTRAHQRHHLYKSLTSPKYICFIARKEKVDPINYAIDKIIKLRTILRKITINKQYYEEFVKKLEDFIVDMLDLCKTSEETEIFMSPKDTKEKVRLPHYHPRLWYVVGLELRKVVAHHNSQSMVFKMWATDDWPSWDTYNVYQKICNSLLRFFPPMTLLVSAVVWFSPSSSWGKLLASPVSRFLNYIMSYTIFLAVLSFQVGSPYQRCNDDKKPLFSIIDYDCTKRGPPNLGTEWVLVLYVVGFCISVIKKQQILWYWKMKWNFIELAMLVFFMCTFGFWVAAFIKNLENDEQPKMNRHMWPHDCAEILAECCLAMATIFAYAKLLQFTQIFPKLGPIQIGLGRQIVDFLCTASIYFVVLLAFATGLLGLYVPYKGCKGIDVNKDGQNGKIKTQDGTFTELSSTLGNLFWYLYGHAGKDPALLLTWQVKQNDSNDTKDVHHYYTQNTGLGLYFVYHLFGSLMMFNMLSGYFSMQLSQVMEQVDMHWKFNRTELYLSFVKDTLLPPPLNIIPPVPAIKAFFHKCCTCNGGLCKECFDVLDESKKKKEWKKILKKYRKFIVELIYRYNEFKDVIDEVAIERDENEEDEKLRRELLDYLGRNPDPGQPRDGNGGGGPSDGGSGEAHSHSGAHGYSNEPSSSALLNSSPGSSHSRSAAPVSENASGAQSRSTTTVANTSAPSSSQSSTQPVAGPSRAISKSQSKGMEGASQPPPGSSSPSPSKSRPGSQKTISPPPSPQS